jgi:hypothetical protein
MALSEVYIAHVDRREIDRLVAPNDPPLMTSTPHSDDDTQLRRLLTLTHLRDWCMERLSQLSLDGRMEEARAVTAEHLELLETMDARRSLWVRIERDDS